MKTAVTELKDLVGKRIVDFREECGNYLILHFDDNSYVSIGSSGYDSGTPYVTDALEPGYSGNCEELVEAGIWTEEEAEARRSADREKYVAKQNAQRVQDEAEERQTYQRLKAKFE